MSENRQVSATPWRRDPGRLEAGIGAWARAIRGEVAALTEIRLPDNGMANDTVLFRLGDEALVTRLATGTGFRSSSARGRHSRRRRRPTIAVS